MAEIQCRLIKAVGTRLMLRTYWGADCPNAYGTGREGGHDATKHLKDVIGERITEWIEPTLYSDDQWPTKCDYCDAAIPEEARRNRQISRKTLFNNESGKPEPGDMYFSEYHHAGGKGHLCRWDNCDDPRGHLIVICPNGREWDTDSRASNCTMKEDRTHRCWVKHGDAPNLHIDKSGLTCMAGAGSIMAGDYHGFLHNGKLVEC